MTELLTVLATPAWVYLAIFGFITIDAMVPVVPIQAIMITAGALVVYGHLSLPLVIAVGALAMFTGDSIAFLLGRTAGHVSQRKGPTSERWLTAKLNGLRHRFAPRNDDAEPSKTRRAAARFTRGLTTPGPLVLLLCRFVPGGRMAGGYHAGRKGYPVRLWVLFDGGASLAWATYGGLVGHIGGTALTQSAWKLFAIAATAAVVFGGAGWILALFGGRKEAAEEAADGEPAGEAADGEADGEAGDNPATTEARAASADEPPPRSSRTATGRS
jgi:membrane-associated protein